MLEHCQITSPVQPLELVYRWSKRSQNGQLVEIRPGGRFAVNHDGFLTITDIQPSDSGLYEVNISNSQGSALHTVQLRVIPMVTTPTGELIAHMHSSIVVNILNCHCMLFTAWVWTLHYNQGYISTVLLLQ